MARTEYHPGEIEVQARAGVREMAERVGGSIHPAIPPAARDFLGKQPMMVVGSVGGNGRVWASLLTGEPGFVRASSEHTVEIAAEPRPCDPLERNLTLGADVGLISVDFATRRRIRLNGKAQRRAGGIHVRVEQVYANCPKYIQARDREPDGAGSDPGPDSFRRSRALTGEQRRLISASDTFFVASAHPASGADASHRGGQPGFIRLVDERTLEWPDYAGNKMFNTLGNITANPNAGLLFVDFEGGDTLQLTGRAKVVWDRVRAADFAGAERVVEFRIEEVVETVGANPSRWRFVGYSPFNPR